MGYHGPLFHLFSVFFKQTSLQFLQPIFVKNVHPVYGAGIRTHNLQIASLSHNHETRAPAHHQKVLHDRFEFKNFAMHTIATDLVARRNLNLSTLKRSKQWYLLMICTSVGLTSSYVEMPLRYFRGNLFKTLEENILKWT